MTAFDTLPLRLIDPIGAGATATVWRAWDHDRRRFVAAKVLSQGEVLTLPLVRGGTVDQLLAEHGGLPTAYVAVLLEQLLGALAALHGVGLVHRDVKPANLLLEPTGSGRPRLHLADFGVTVAVGARVDPAGTDGYLPPEALAGAPPEPRHDLYAAGVTAVELLTGRVPRRPRDVPHGPLRPLLRALTDPDPAGRPVSAEAARAALQALGVPAGAPWQRLARPPDVPDRLRPLTLLERWRILRVREPAPRSSPRSGRRRRPRRMRRRGDSPRRADPRAPGPCRRRPSVRAPPRSTPRSRPSRTT
jgi:serine/threonine protein kinase